MPQHVSLSAVLFSFPDEDPEYNAAILVSLGEGAGELTARLADYAQSLPHTNWMHKLGQLIAYPLALETLLSQASRVPCIIAVSGSLADEEIQLAAQLIGLGGHCTVVVDATTGIRSEWTSVIRLPPHRSRDAQWAWCMRVYFDAMLNRGLICVDTHDIQACTKNRMSQFTVVHAEGERRAIEGVEHAVQSLTKRCDLSACDTFLLLFHSGSDFRIKELHWGIQAFKNAIRKSAGEDYLLNVGHFPTQGKKFAISLMAGTPRRS